jgi:hypothetical protein
VHDGVRLHGGARGGPELVLAHEVTHAALRDALLEHEGR